MRPSASLRAISVIGADGCDGTSVRRELLVVARYVEVALV